jgi:hypothetical protein
MSYFLKLLIFFDFSKEARGSQKTNRIQTFELSHVTNDLIFMPFRTVIHYMEPKCNS